MSVVQSKKCPDLHQNGNSPSCTQKPKTKKGPKLSKFKVIFPSYFFYPNQRTSLLFYRGENHQIKEIDTSPSKTSTKRAKNIKKSQKLRTRGLTKYFVPNQLKHHQTISKPEQKCHQTISKPTDISQKHYKETRTKYYQTISKPEQNIIIPSLNHNKISSNNLQTN